MCLPSIWFLLSFSACWLRHFYLAPSEIVAIPRLLVCLKMPCLVLGMCACVWVYIQAMFSHVHCCIQHSNHSYHSYLSLSATISGCVTSIFVVVVASILQNVLLFCCSRGGLCPSIFHRACISILSSQVVHYALPRFGMWLCFLIGANSKRTHIYIYIYIDCHDKCQKWEWRSVNDSRLPNQNQHTTNQII